MTCRVDGCERQKRGTDGFCAMHYKRWKRTGETGPAGARVVRSGCDVPVCDEPHAALGFCDTHYARFKASGEAPVTPIRRYGQEKPPCSRLMCDAPGTVKGLCERHYRRERLMVTYEVDFSWARYDAMYEAQQGQCALCFAELVWDSKLTHIDHCHTAGRVRGLLCSMCNQGLGSFRDDPKVLARALRYVMER